ncbi:hypothetical protein D043_0766B, partial [Vibrio parahaemolyticus EKP-021]
NQYKFATNRQYTD